jgi:hypothetical protein
MLLIRYFALTFELYGRIQNNLATIEILNEILPAQKGLSLNNCSKLPSFQFQKKNSNHGKYFVALALI